MPVKRKNKKETESAPTSEHVVEPVVLQLPITGNRLDELMGGQEMTNVLEYNPNIVDPQPYIPQNTFVSYNEAMETDASVEATKGCSKRSSAQQATSNVQDQQATSETSHHSAMCFWCCHSIDHMEYGMPTRYDVFHKNFTMFGTFCSLECAAAYNYSVHMGSDRVWEIHSWIQMLAHRYGYKGMVRPAPSRYLLKMFNGPLSIEEFRNAHKGLARTYVMNIPPFIHVTSQMEILNTSFLDKTSDGCAVEKKQPKKKTSAFLLEKKQPVESKLACTIDALEST